MAAIRIVPGQTEVQLLARSRAGAEPPDLSQAPGGLYPLRSAAYEIDEYRIMSGWPVSVPPCDIRIEAMVSADGIVLEDRLEPTALVTNADMRWVADVDYYDQTTLLWRPIQSDVSPWTTSPSNAPTLVTDYEYQVDDQRFVDRTALNFDSNTIDWMWNDLSLAMGGTQGYTVVMVLSPNSIYGNDSTTVDNALWAAEDTTGAQMIFTVRDSAVWLTTESLPAQKGVAIGNALESTAPTYLGLVVGRPQTTLYAASGPSRMLSRSLAAGAAAVPLSTRFWLGNAPSSASATMDMALLDLGIYGRPLTKEEMAAEFSSLSAVYGGDT